MTDNGEDCPHRQQLEHTLLHCQTQSEILQATRENYLSIIEEFQRDLEELTVQVEQQQQQEQQQNELSFKASTETLEICTNPLEQQNETIMCQMYGLRNALAERDMQIDKLQKTLNDYANLNESNNLQAEEISMLKKINSELKQKVVQISCQLKAQEAERLKLCKTYDDLVNCFEEQKKELKVAIRKADSLENRLTQREQQDKDYRTERNLLCEEVISLKQKLAENTGRERALNDQLRCRQQDLDKTRSVVNNMDAHMRNAKGRHKTMIESLCRANEETRLEIRNAHNSCKEMQQKLTQHTNVIEQQKNIIESFRQWKDAQVRSDEAMRQCIKRNEEHIVALMNERHEYKLLYRDYCILETELRRRKQPVDSHLFSANVDHPSTVVQRGRNVLDNMNFRLRAMNETSQRLAEHNRTLDDRNNPPTNDQCAQGDRQPT